MTSTGRGLPSGVKFVIFVIAAVLVTSALSKYVFHDHDWQHPQPPPQPPIGPTDPWRKNAPPGWLGFKIMDKPDGVLVTEVYAGGPADLRGIVSGDILTTVNGVKATRNAVFKAVSTAAIGSDVVFERRRGIEGVEKVAVTVERGGGTDALLESTVRLGAESLASEQLADGLWPHFANEGIGPIAPGVATSALACAALAIAGNEGGAPGQNALEKGIDALIAHQAPDGGLDDKGVFLARRAYATAFFLIALKEQKFHPDWHALEAERAREWLCRDQLTEANGYPPTDPNYGGWSDYLMSGRSGADMSLTSWVLDALCASGLAADRPEWTRAKGFLERCQNTKVRGASAETQGKEAPLRDGGFGFSPVDSKAGLVNVGEGIIVPRSYGSATADGLRGLAAAGMAKDERAQKAASWLASWFTLDRTPGFDPKDMVGWADGMRYYWLSSLARGFKLAHIRKVALGPGAEGRSWPDEVVRWLANRQRPIRNCWQNSADVMHEDTTTVATSFALIALGAARDELLTQDTLTVRGVGTSAPISTAPVVPAASTDEERGRLIFQGGTAGCATCHNDSNSGTGPSLIGVGERYLAWKKGSVSDAADQFKHHIRDPETFPSQGHYPEFIKDKSKGVPFWPGHMPAYPVARLPEKDLDSVVAFLLTRTGNLPVGLPTK
ncbi:MAG TPA: PDZ domain-containing protein [Planctomycetota bacterium]|nr:PDZ domain-containing protein [Planctomycetota bacterium]